MLSVMGGEVAEAYRDFVIEKVNRHDHYGAWFQFHDYAFIHKDSDGESYNETYGSGKTIDDCKKQIDDYYENT